MLRRDALKKILGVGPLALIGCPVEPGFTEEPQQNYGITATKDEHGALIINGSKCGIIKPNGGNKVVVLCNFIMDATGLEDNVSTFERTEE